MRIDTSPAQFKRDLHQKDTAALEHLKAAGEKFNRTGTMSHKLVVAELKRRGSKKVSGSVDSPLSGGG